MPLERIATKVVHGVNANVDRKTFQVDIFMGS
jgi:hypothetical protein